MRAAPPSRLSPASCGNDLASGFALLTRLPVPAHRHSGAASAWTWPLVGAILGAGAAALVWLAQRIGLSADVTAALALAALALATGALHEDGLADTADGLLGGQSRARRLEIMKDSRIGSFAAVALVLVILIEWSALSALIARGQATTALIAAACLSRLPMVLFMALLPPARSNGLSAATGRPSPKVAVAASLLALALGLCLLGTRLFPALAASALVCLALALAARRLIGGQTGDILGANQKLAAASLLAFL